MLPPPRPPIRICSYFFWSAGANNFSSSLWGAPTHCKRVYNLYWYYIARIKKIIFQTFFTKIQSRQTFPNSKIWNKNFDHNSCPIIHFYSFLSRIIKARAPTYSVFPSRVHVGARNCSTCSIDIKNCPTRQNDANKIAKQKQRKNTAKNTPN